MNNQLQIQVQQSIEKSRKELWKTYQSLDRNKEASELALYQAHGNVRRSKVNFEEISKFTQKVELLKRSTVQATHLTNTAVTAASKSNIESSEAVKNAATAALTMQNAADSIAELYSQTAAAEALAKATISDSQIFNQIKLANDNITSAAQCAEDVSITSLNATIDASKTLMKKVAGEAQSLLSDVTTLSQSIATQYADSAAKVPEVNQNLTQAYKLQNDATEALAIAESRAAALKLTYDRVNQVSNHDLLLSDVANKLKYLWCEHGLEPVNPGDGYNISFRAFQNQKIIKEYRLMMVPRKLASTFDINTASSVGSSNYFAIKIDQSNPQNSPFLIQKKVMALSNCIEIVDRNGQQNPCTESELRKEDYYSVNFFFKQQCQLIDQAEFPLMKTVVFPYNETGASEKQSPEDHFNPVDYQGNSINLGKSYVAFVYADYLKNPDIKQLGMLSLPSPFTILQKYFPSVPTFIEGSPNMIINQPHRIDKCSVDFQIKVPADLQKQPGKENPLDLRVILVNEKDAQRSQWMPPLYPKRHTWLIDAYCEGVKTQHELENDHPEQAMVSLKAILELKHLPQTDKVELEHILKLIKDKKHDPSILNSLKKFVSGVQNEIQYLIADCDSGKPQPEPLNNPFPFDTSLMATLDPADYSSARLLPFWPPRQHNEVSYPGNIASVLRKEFCGLREKVLKYLIKHDHNFDWKEWNILISEKSRKDRVALIKRLEKEVLKLQADIVDDKQKASEGADDQAAYKADPAKEVKLRNKRLALKEVKEKEKEAAKDTYAAGQLDQMLMKAYLTEEIALSLAKTISLSKEFLLENIQNDVANGHPAQGHGLMAYTVKINDETLDNYGLPLQINKIEKEGVIEGLILSLIKKSFQNEVGAAISAEPKPAARLINDLEHLPQDALTDNLVSYRAIVLSTGSLSRMHDNKYHNSNSMFSTSTICLWRNP